MQTGKSIWSNERPTQWIWGWRQLQREKNWWASPRDTRKPSWRKNLKTLQKPKNNGLNGWRDVAASLTCGFGAKGFVQIRSARVSSCRSGTKSWGALKWKLLVTTFPNGVHRRQRHWRSWKKRKSWGPMKEIRRRQKWLRLAGHVMLVSAGKLQTCWASGWWWVSWLWCEVGFGAHMAPWEKESTSICWNCVQYYRAFSGGPERSGSAPAAFCILLTARYAWLFCAKEDPAAGRSIGSFAKSAHSA